MKTYQQLRNQFNTLKKSYELELRANGDSSKKAIELKGEIKGIVDSLNAYESKVRQIRTGYITSVINIGKIFNFIKMKNEIT